MRSPMPTSRVLASPTRAFLTASALLLVAGCGPGEDAAPTFAPDAMVYEGATVITGQDAPPIENAVFVVEDGRFSVVGSAAAVTLPEGLTTVDLSGRTVIPALINTHVHLAVEREARVRELRHHAYYGAGAVTSLGHDEGEAAFAVRDDPPAGAALGLTAGRGITRPEPGRSEVPFWVDTAEEARAAVRELAADSVDLVKIWVDDRGGQYEKMTPELYGAVIDEAHAHGLQVTAHIFSLEDAKGLLRAGVDAFAHSVRSGPVDEELLGLLAERPDFVYVPNLPGSGIPTELGWLGGTIPQEVIREMESRPAASPEEREPFLVQAGNLERLHEAGVTIAFGTDGGSPFAAHLELADMVEAGMPPADVLVAATRNSARFLGLDDRGTIESGKRADFVVLEANPLDDITNTRLIQDVYLGGQAMNRDSVAAELLAAGPEG